MEDDSISLDVNLIHHVLYVGFPDRQTDLNFQGKYNWRRYMYLFIAWVFVLVFGGWVALHKNMRLFAQWG